jgi:ribosomal protein L11 methyltransferase
MVSAVYDMMGAEGCVIADKNDFKEDNVKGEWDYVDEKRIAKMPDYVTVTAYLGEGERELAEALRDKISGLREFADFDLGSLEYEWRMVDDEDWKYEWKKYYKPFDVGNKLYVRPYWELPKDTKRHEIVLDPGMAFGNGTHETTYMCMELIEANLKPNDSVYDVGCGTGILAVAAVKLGAGETMALDRDAIAVDVARKNIALNGLQERIEVMEGDLLSGQEKKADMIIANIIADIIIDFAQDAYEKLNDGGVFISSGIINSRADETAEAIAQAGFEIIDKKHMGEWHAFAAVKNG